jgi:hypothetical protein
MSKKRRYAMKVYHGSYTKVNRIDLTKCASHKDFGRGFYVTKFRKHAESWAEIIGEKNGTQGVITEFDFIEGSFTESICKIKRFERYNEEWLNFVILNRNRKTQEPAHDYDIVEGPVANDKIQNTLRLYLNGKIEKDKFLQMLMHHEETHQICFCTLNSLQAIERTDCMPTMDIVMLTEPLLKQLVLDLQIGEDKATDIFYASKIFAQVSDENTDLYKKSWQEIYEMLKEELKHP